MKREFKTELKGKRIVLRKLEPTIQMAETMYAVIDRNREHLLSFLRWAAKDQTSCPEDTLKFLFKNEDEFEAGTKIDYGIYVDGTYVGSAGVFKISEKQHSAEIGYWLDGKHCGKGYMTEAVQLIEDEYFGNQNIHRIQIRAREDNHASAAIPKRLNYSFEGLCRENRYYPNEGKYYGDLTFSKLKSEWKKD